MTTGERIRQARKAAGLTQRELADKVGVKFSAIHKYETGLIVNLKRETIAELAKALDVSPAWLMCMDDDQNTRARIHSPTHESTEEQRLLKLWRLADARDRETIWNILGRYDEVSTGTESSTG